MDKADVVRTIRAVGVIPVVRAGSAADAVALADAIVAGGCPILEITLTVPGALQVIERLAQAAGPAALIGAGSVLDAKAARACIAAGARFIVSPVFDADVVACCHEAGVAVLPGALTPTEILQAWNAGADLVKVFPAGALGGASYVRSLLAPMPQLRLVPTGGVTAATAAGFIAAGAVAVGAGTDLASPDAVRAGRLGAVTSAARAYAEAVRTARAAAGSQVDDASLVRRRS